MQSSHSPEEVLKTADHGKGPLSPSWPPPPFLEQAGCSALMDQHREKTAPGCWQYGWCPHTFTRWAAAGEEELRATCSLCNYLSLTICIKWLHSAVEWGTLLSWRQIPALRSASFMSLIWLTARHVGSLWIKEWDGTELPGPGNLCQNFGCYRPIRQADRPLVRK